MARQKKEQQEELNQTPPESNAIGKVLLRVLEREMAESYLDYAMSVIVARALPDVRDGLKPVHRRILYAMWQMGLRGDRKRVKSAAVVGEVLKLYHPHGDIPVYDSLVRMAQPFSMRAKLVDGQGNFGSIDGDPPAAMRYTETKMTKVAEELLIDIEKNTIDVNDNYDGTHKEPKVLPARLPNLLLNGSLGIAVGMATNIPPHNLGELCDAINLLIDKPTADIDEIMTVLKGPDFPTGAIIYDVNTIKQAYTTGKGSITMRAVAEIEENDRNNMRIVISKLPYQVNKAELIAKIANLVREKKIEGIADIRDESDRKAGVQVVIELKTNAFPKKVLNRLYELTPMQTAFHINMVALIDGIQPRLLSLKNVLEEYIKHRQFVIIRRTQFDLDRAKERSHILEGLKKALDHIDDIIDAIKKSDTREIAHKNLISKFRLTDVQATAILEMRLATLAGLERKKIDDELTEKYQLIKELASILADDKKILGLIRDEVLSIKNQYADERRTKIVRQSLGKFSVEDLIPNEQVIVTLTKNNYIKRVPVAIYRSQHRGGKGIIGMETKEEDTIDWLLSTWTHNNIYFFTNQGRVFPAKVYDLPAGGRTAKGQAIVNILQLAPDERVSAMLAMDNKQNQNSTYFFMMMTKNGVIKKTNIQAYQNIRKSGIICIKLDQGDELRFIRQTSGRDNILVVTKHGQSIYFKEEAVRPMGRGAAGVRGIKLRTGDEVISFDVVAPAVEKSAELLTVVENGLGKRTSIKNHFNTQNRGGIGVRATKVTAKTGPVVGSQVVYHQDQIDVVLVSRQGQIIRIPLKSVKLLSRDTQGVTLMRLHARDGVSSVTVVEKNHP